MIRFENVTIKYGRKNACNDISFSAENGEITILLGRNGSGKSSLLKAACGLIKYSGNISSDGKIAYMPQILPPVDMSVLELVMCGKNDPSSLFKTLSKEETEACMDIIQKTELEEYINTPVSQLSGGERQRAFFAMLLARDASTIILDEPTANLDSEYKEMVYRFAIECKQKGHAVLMVLHHRGEAQRIADKIVEMPTKSI